VTEARRTAGLDDLNLKSIWTWAEDARFVVGFGRWASAVSLCDVCGVVDGSGLEGVGEGGELPEAFDPPVLAFGGEEAGGGPTQSHIGAVPVAA
jgi:hypothetical protein